MAKDKLRVLKKRFVFEGFYHSLSILSINHFLK